MSALPPSFDDLVDRDDATRDRLRETHELLVAAGPPPELPPSLQEAPPEPQAKAIRVPRRRYTALAALAVAAIVLFGVGYALGGGDRSQEPVRTVRLAGPAGASGILAVQPVEAAGNWPLLLNVGGLPPLAPGQSYTLWLARGDRLTHACGTFVVDAGGAAAGVSLNAPYELDAYSGWIVVRTGTNTPHVLRSGKV